MRRSTLNPKFERYASVMILVLGSGMRFHQYLFNRSFWLDEASLALNILYKDWQSLLSGSLVPLQVAPPGFLLLSKLSASIFGYEDRFLRLVPFISSILLLIFAYLISKREFNAPISRISFLALCSFSPVLYYYSTEFKQYGMEAFITLLLIYLGGSEYKRKPLNGILIIAGVLAPWFSLSSIFILAGIGIHYLLASWRSRDRAALLRNVGAILLWMISFSILYLTSLRGFHQNSTLAQYWSQGYAQFPPASWSDIFWFPMRLLDLCIYTFQYFGPLPMTMNPVFYNWLSILLLMALLTGTIMLWRRSKQSFTIIVVSFIMTLIASSLGLYPFIGRTIIFLAPLCLLIFCYGIDAFWGIPCIHFKLISVMLAIFSIAVCLWTVIPVSIRPSNINDIKSSLAYLQDHYQDGDLIVISEWSQPAYTFYCAQLDLDCSQPYHILPVSNDYGEFMAGIDDSRMTDRVWLLFSHRFSERELLIAALDSRYSLLLAYEGEGSGIYLWSIPIKPMN
jgi:hypothetical protein